MAILQVAGLSKYWGVDLLFRDIGFLLNEGEKMALVGRNGSGKTTLLRILTGQMEYDEGTIVLPSGSRVGYLSQDPDFVPTRTLLEEAQSVFAHLQKWERDLRSLEDRMGAASSEAELEEVMAEYARVTSRFEAAGGYDAPARVKSVLHGLGFTQDDFAKPVEVLSGGQKVRLGLAKLLLEGPDLMLLDEPTNHLDLEATEWLEGYFRNMKSAAILVSHDRYFLDKVITRTLELENHRSDLYYGNYSYYLEEKERRLEAAMDAFERQQKEAEKLRTFYEKWRNTPSRKDQAMSRKRKLDKMELMDRPEGRQRAMKLAFAMDYETGNDVLVVENLSKSFGEKPVFSGVNLRLSKGDKVALVGPNGCGKSTLLKILHGLLQPSGGSFFWGVGVERGYFSQDLDSLDYSRTCLEEMLEIPGFTKFDAYSLLGRFLFSGEDALKQIGQCSGGERNRLILAKLTVAGANVLLLDEPTNHLDLHAKEVLEEALIDYPGTVLFVSHDRFFVDRVANKVWEFAPDGVAEWEGNYSMYKAEKERLALYNAQQREDGAPQSSRAAAKGPRPADKAEAPTGKQASGARREVSETTNGSREVNESTHGRREANESTRGRREANESTRGRREVSESTRNRREERRAAEAVRRLEASIQELEARKAELEERMSDPDIFKSATGREAVAEYNALQSDLERLYVEWEQAASQ